jgi:HlyD family secretion protein
LGLFPGRGAGGPDATVFLVQPTDLLITLKENGELKPRESIELRNEVEGGSTILFIVPESTRVKKGDLLVELASDQIKERYDTELLALRTAQAACETAVQELAITRNENASRLKKAEIDRTVAELELRQYLEGEFQQKLKEAEIAIKQTEQEIQRKEDELKKNERLLERGFVSGSKIDQLRFELEKARMTLEKNVLTKKILLEYDQPKMEMQKRSAVDQTTQEYEREQKRCESREAQALARVEEQKATLAMREKRVARLAEQLAKCRIVAPVDGVVQYAGAGGGWRWGGEPLAVGQKVYEGQVLIILPNTTQMLVSARIHEADRHQVKEGMLCEVRVPAVPGRVFTGQISKIAKFADSANLWLNPNLKEHATEILLDETDAPLSPGDSAEIKIFIAQISNVLAVPVQCVFSRGPRSFVFVQRGQGAEPVEVKLGRSNASLIEVVEGLSPGDRVLMHADDRHLAMLPSPDVTAIAAGPAAPERSVERPAAAAGSEGRGLPGADSARGPETATDKLDTRTAETVDSQHEVDADSDAGGESPAGQLHDPSPATQPAESDRATPPAKAEEEH